MQLEMYGSCGLYIYICADLHVGMPFAGPVSESVVKVNPITGTLTLEVCPQPRTQRLIEPVRELKAAVADLTVHLAW